MFYSASERRVKSVCTCVLACASENAERQYDVLIFNSEGNTGLPINAVSFIRDYNVFLRVRLFLPDLLMQF